MSDDALADADRMERAGRPAQARLLRLSHASASRPEFETELTAAEAEAADELAHEAGAEPKRIVYSAGRAVLIFVSQTVFHRAGLELSHAAPGAGLVLDPGTRIRNASKPSEHRAGCRRVIISRAEYGVMGFGLQDDHMAAFGACCTLAVDRDLMVIGAPDMSCRTVCEIADGPVFGTLSSLTVSGPTTPIVGPAEAKALFEADHLRDLLRQSADRAECMYGLVYPSALLVGGVAIGGLTDADGVAIALAESAVTTGVRSLGLVGGGLTDRGAAVLAEAPAFAQIERLDISGNPALSPRAIFSLAWRFDNGLVV